MIKKFALFLALFTVGGNFIPCFAKDSAASQKSFFSRVGNWFKDTIGETLEQAHKNETEHQRSEADRQVVQQAVVDSVSTSLSNIVKSVADILVQEHQQEQRYQAQILHPVVQDSQLEKNSSVKQQATNVAPHGQTITQEPIIQPAVEQSSFFVVLKDEVSSGLVNATNSVTDTLVQNHQEEQEINQKQEVAAPTFQREFWNGAGWFLEKTCDITFSGFQKVGEVMEWCSDRLDELRKHLEERQKELEEREKQQKFLEENFRRMEAEQRTRAPILDIPKNYQDGPIKQEFKVPEPKKNILIEPKSVIHDCNVPKQELMQDILTSSRELSDSDTASSQIDIQENQEQQSILEQKIKQKTEQNITQKSIEHIVEQNIADKNQKEKQEERQKIEQNIVVPPEIRQKNIMQQQEQEQNRMIVKNLQEMQKLELSEGLKNLSDIPQKSELFKLFGVSFDKKQLMFFGAGAAAAVVICGVTYVLYKNKEKFRLEKVGNYMGRHKFAISGVISAVCGLFVIGVYAKEQGMTLQSTGSWITNFLGFRE